MILVSSKEGEVYYLKLLLIHMKGTQYFDDLLCVKGDLEPYSSFKQSAQKRGAL